MLNFTEDSVARWRRELELAGSVQLPNAFEHKVLDMLLRSFSLQFERRALLEDYSSEFTLVDVFTKQKIDLLFNTQAFYQLMTSLLGIEVNFTKQRLYWTDKSCDGLVWHDDSDEIDGRVAALRVELSADAYRGGELQFRTKSSGPLQSFGQMKVGEMVLFRIEPGKFEHRVTNVLEGRRQSLTVFLCQRPRSEA